MVRELGLAKRHKKAKAAGVEVKDLPEQIRVDPVTREELESVRGHITSVEGEVLALRDSLPNFTEDDQAKIQGDIAGINETIEVTAKAAGNALSKVVLLEEQFESFDLGEHDVEEFPIL